MFGDTHLATFTQTSIIYETYKLCDGHPRAVATGHEWTKTFTGAMSGHPSTYYQDMPPSGRPQHTVIATTTDTITSAMVTCANALQTPHCSIDNNDCRSLFTAWTAGGFSRLEPPCYGRSYAPSGGPCDVCSIRISSVRLLYFPVSMNGDLCGECKLPDRLFRVRETDRSVDSTASATSIGNWSAPSTVEVSGTTFTSGYAYLSYDGVTATGYNGICGSPKPQGILPLPSSEVFSYRGHAAAMPVAGDVHWPFNFADLSPNPVPWDAWIRQELCYGHEAYPTCQTITQAAYRPWLVYPSAFWSMDPLWAGCSSGIFGIMDPPSALPTQHEMAMPTSQGMHARPMTTARPATDPTRSQVKPTHNPTSTHAKVVHGEDPATKGEARPDRTTGGNAKTETDGFTTWHVPTGVLHSSHLSVGSMRVLPVSRGRAISIGTDIHSVGHHTKIGNTYMSLGSKTLLIGNDPKVSTADPAAHGALSIVATVQLESDPRVKVTLDAEVYTAYSGGILEASGTTMVLPKDGVNTINDHTLSLGQGGVEVDGTAHAFNRPSHGTSTGWHDPGDAAAHTKDELIAALYTQGASTITLLGHIDAAGKTVMTHGSSIFTFTGQKVIEDGITFRPVMSPIAGDSATHPSPSSAEGPHWQTGLPSIVSRDGTRDSSLTSPPQRSRTEHQPAGRTSTTSGASTPIETPSVASLLAAFLVAQGLVLLLTAP